MKYRIFFLLVSLLSGAFMAAKDLHYTLRIENPHTHIINISADVTGLSGEYADFYMPVWTPGSYLVREFSRNVLTFTAHKKSTPLSVEKINKNTWRVLLNGHSSISVDYQVYAFEYSVRTSFVDTDLALLNGASLFIIPQGFEHRKIKISVEPYMSWQKINTELPNYKGGHFTYMADDLDHLIDSPILLGNQRTYTFTVSDIPHVVAISDTGNYDPGQIMEDTRKVVTNAHSVFASVPYDHYTFFLNLNDSGYGGLEHKNSCNLIYDPWKFTSRSDYLKFMGLISHEFFHVYNVKRIRPVSLGPFDYDTENYTDLLWVSEGMTAYYDNHLLRRSGIATPEEYLNLLAEDIQKLESTPGRMVQSVSESSFDAWIKLYRPNENSLNSTVSYYLKGSLIGVILDLQIRQSTQNRNSLDNVFKSLWDDFTRSGKGFTEPDFISACEMSAGSPLPEIWDMVHRVGDIDFDSYLHYAGLHLMKEFLNDDEKIKAWFGIKFQNGNLKISQVPADSPAYRDGLNVNDELLAINGIRLTPDNVFKHLGDVSKEKASTILISRRGKIRSVQVTPGDFPENKYKIVKIENPDDEMMEVYSGWICDPWKTENDPE